jgi:hypothetical protein
MSTLVTQTLQELATGDSVGAKYVVHGSAKAWANLNGTGTIALRGSLNISSVVDNGTGDYTYNLSSAMLAADYSVLVSSTQFTNDVTDYAAVSYRCRSTNTSFTLIDVATQHTAVHGDLA